MVFSDLFFIYCFLPACLILYFAFKNIKYKNAVLIVFSLIFYAWGEPFWIILLIFNVTVNYLYSLLILKYKDTPDSPYPKLGVILSLATSLGLLAVFKYSGFIAVNLNLLFPFDISVPQISLPIGISFYTFQIISYIMDCYWGKVNVQKNYFKFLMYVSLFPQLVAGPIVRYSVIENEIENRKTTVTDVSEGITRFAFGLGKKVIIANNLSVIVETFFGGNIASLSVMGTWYAVIVYALQVYFDFSGYSDMAIGLGRIFGFRFNENFNYPFICRNITEFWQRWHISLGSFFRDYLLYVPIFGKRRQYLNLFLVWFCTGLWHGASWNYVIWGLYFGFFIFLERKIGNKRMKTLPSAILHIYNKLVIIIGFGIFYFTDVGRLGQFLKNLIGLNGNALSDGVTSASLANNAFLLSAALMFCFPVIPLLKKAAAKHAVLAGAANIAANALLLVICSILLVNATNNPFLYFNF